MFIFLFFYTISLVYANPTIYVQEEFPTQDSMKSWIESTYKGNDQGKFGYSSGKYFNDAKKDSGIQTLTDTKFYGISYKLQKSIDNFNKTLVVQFQVKNEQSIDCGGGYIKLMGSDMDQSKFHGETPYKIMFGPDICGYSVKKTHVIINYKEMNQATKKDIACKDDELSHIYTLILRPDNTYEVLIDNSQVETGNLEDDFDFLLPRKIDDPKAKKPDDWVEEERIPDPNDTKPADWDKAKTIADPNATKPNDWDNEMDGEWEPPQIDNPDYKGDWKPKEVDNPKYKGAWVHPQIDNPDFEPDLNLYYRGEISFVGFDLWQVKSGTIFDNILITDDPVYAFDYAEKTWKVTSEGEAKMKAQAEESTSKSSDSASDEDKTDKDTNAVEDMTASGDKVSGDESIKDDKADSKETSEPKEPHTEL